MLQLTEKLEHSLVIFLHISKTAGTTLREVFRRQYPSSQFVYYYRKQGDDDMQVRHTIDQLPPEKKRQFRALSAATCPIGTVANSHRTVSILRCCGNR